MTGRQYSLPGDQDWRIGSLAELARGLADGSMTSRRLVESCLERIGDPAGEGSRTFTSVNGAALETADTMDALRKAGQAPSPFAGIPISVKDLFNVRGERTLAGSTALGNSPPASRDAPAIARLRAAGFVFVGRTNMTEFAFSGLGLNPHHGTPRNPYDRVTGRIPGGSSSGAAVSVTDAMAAAGLGTDTGGSCRIPAALCGTVGFKPTARRIPRRGVYPLSSSLDSVGSLANSVACCASIDSIMAESQPAPDLSGRSPGSIRLGVLGNLVLDDIDDKVAKAFDRALSTLSAMGVSVSDVRLAELDDLPAINAKGGLASAEAFAWHRPMLAAHAGEYDPRVRARIENGAEQSAADYIDLLHHRRRLIGAADAAIREFDAVIYPTVPFVAPTIEALADDTDYVRINALALRNTSVTNFLDRCAVSIPIHEPGDAPVGLNLMGATLGDHGLLAVANGIESLLAAGG